MANSYPYTSVPSKIEPIIKKLQSAGIPDKVNQKHLEALGFNDRNEQRIISILKFLGLIDNSGNPLPIWQQYRDSSQAPLIMSQAIKSSYSELFNLYPHAYSQDNKTLQNFFSSKTGVGDRALNYMVRTFKELCKLADFNVTDSLLETSATVDNAQLNPSNTTNITTTNPQSQRNSILSSEFDSSAGLTLNVNIELVLPAQADSETYDNLFKSLRRHILNPNE